MHGRHRERKKHPAVYECNCGVIAVEYGVVSLHGKLRLHCHRGVFLGGVNPRDAFATGKHVTSAGLPRERPVHGISPAASIATLLLGKAVDGAYIIGRTGNGSAGRAQGVVHRGALRQHDRGAIGKASQAIALRARAIDADVNGNRAWRRCRGGFRFGLLVCRRRTRGRCGARVFGCARRCRPGCRRPSGRSARLRSLIGRRALRLFLRRIR